MSEADLQVIRDQYEAVNERDWGRVMSHYAPDVVLTVTDTWEIRAGTYEGIDAVGGWFGDWFSAFDKDARFEIKEMVDLPNDWVAVVAEHRARGRASGVEVEASVCWAYEVLDGKVKQVRSHDSLEQAVAEHSGH